MTHSIQATPPLRVSSLLRQRGPGLPSQFLREVVPKSTPLKSQIASPVASCAHCFRDPYLRLRSFQKSSTLDGCRELASLAHSSSDFHRSTPQDGHVNVLGFLPSFQVISAHLPHSIEVLIGSSKVVSTLNIGLPASRNSMADGSHSSFNENSSASFPIAIPTTSRITPPMERGTESPRENVDPSLRVSPEPIAMQSQAEMMVFNWRFETRGFEPMGARQNSEI